MTLYIKCRANPSHPKTGRLPGYGTEYNIGAKTLYSADSPINQQFGHQHNNPQNHPHATAARVYGVSSACLRRRHVKATAGAQ